MRLISELLTVLAVGSVAVPAAATTINFDDGAIDAPVGGMYAAQGLTFSNAVFSSNFGYNGSTGALGIASTSDLEYVFDVSQPIIGMFSSAQNAVGIRALDVGRAGVRLEAYDASNMLVGTDEFTGSGEGVGTNYDLSVSGAGITSFRLFQPNDNPIANSFLDGVFFDNLSFSPGVPEPASWMMMIAGFGLTGAVLRRKRAGLRVA